MSVGNPDNHWFENQLGASDPSSRRERVWPWVHVDVMNQGPQALEMSSKLGALEDDVPRLISSRFKGAKLRIRSTISSFESMALRYSCRTSKSL